MPVIKCGNGKYRIGSGACIYETKESADKAWKAILAQGKYKKDKYEAAWQSCRCCNKKYTITITNQKTQTQCPHCQAVNVKA